jgi:hypothetical protein
MNMIHLSMRFRHDDRRRTHFLRGGVRWNGELIASARVRATRQTPSRAACRLIAFKDEPAMYVMDHVMDRLSQRIEAVTNGFTDPAQVYAFGIRNVMIAATTDQRWRWVLRRSEAIAGAMYRVMGPYAIRDIRNAVSAGRYRVEDPELAWRQASHAIAGFSLAVSDKTILPVKMDEAVVNLLGMVGVRRGEAWEIARRPCPSLPAE